MTGDQADCLARIKALLPPWFGQGDTPVLDAFLSGPAWALAWVYSLYAYAALQTRLLTATDGFLDLISVDFFGAGLLRGDDSDDTYRRKISTAIFREKATTDAIIAVLTQLTGNVPTVTETGAYAVTVEIDAGTTDHAEVAAAVEAVRPICATITITYL